MQISDSIGHTIGNTPLVKLSRFGKGLRHNLLAKCEFMNPGGSVKDRIAWHMVARAEEDGRLSPGGTIVEATAGNTGIGLAIAATIKGYRLITVMSEKVSKDKVDLLKALGAQVVVVPSGKSIDDPDHFINRAQQIAKSEKAWLADQFNNVDNVSAHYDTTGPEIWEQTDGTVDALVAGAGTGGTLSGAGRFLKERKSSVKLVLADPVGSILANVVCGLPSKTGSYLVEGIGQDFVPGNLHVPLLDHAFHITDEESIRASYALVKQESIFVGSSSGCIAAAAVKFCNELEGSGKNVVIILPDGGRGYMSTIYDDAWLCSRSMQISSGE